MAKTPLFVRPAHYRLRRIHDAARLLPIVGSLLFLFPILWGEEAGQTAARSTASDAIYLFLVWLLLIVAAVALVRSLNAMAEEDEADPADRHDYDS